MKFINLLKKELSELINAQMILSIVAMVAIFWIMGNVMTTAMNDIVEDTSHPKVNICDLDDTDITRELISSIRDTGVELKSVSVTDGDYADTVKKNDIKGFIVIPKGFSEAVENGERPELISVEKLSSAATMTNISGGNDTAISVINSRLTALIAERKGISEEALADITTPASYVAHTVVDDKSAEISSVAIIGKIAIQNMILPLVVTMLLLLTSQSLIASVSNEKIDKTLETLLSAPISRGSVITAKMLAAAIVALINAGAMMVGTMAFAKAATGEALNEAMNNMPDMSDIPASTGDALRQLGLNLSVGDYLLVGLQLFLTIMICLAISILLGALVNDTKSSQTVILPLVMLVMIPWIISMFTDLSSMPTGARMLIYAIPFTHTFTAIPNLMFGNTTLFWGGLAYQFVIFLIVMFFVLRLFKSDKILTLSLNLGQKSKFKKKGASDEA